MVTALCALSGLASALAVALVQTLRRARAAEDRERVLLAAQKAEADWRDAEPTILPFPPAVPRLARDERTYDELDDDEKAFVRWFFK